MTSIDIVRFNPHEASAREKRMIERTARIASASQMRQKHGAILVTNGNIRAVGINVKQNDFKPWVPHDYLSTHAEINALSQTQSQLVNGTLYVVRINKAGQLMLSMPCDNCIGYMIKWTNLRKVVHS